MSKLTRSIQEPIAIALHIKIDCKHANGLRLPVNMISTMYNLHLGASGFFGAKAARMFCKFRLFQSSKYVRTCGLPDKEDQSKSKSKSESISVLKSQYSVRWHLNFWTSTASRRAVRHSLSTTEEPEDKKAAFWDRTSTISKWNSRCAANGKHECILRYL